MGTIVAGYLISGGAAINVDCGFVPDIVEVWNEDASTGDIGFMKKWPGESDGDSMAITILADNGSTADVNLGEEGTSGLSDYDTVSYQGSNWTASTAYVVGDIVRPLATKNGYAYQCTSAGTSDSSEPTWGTTLGGTTSDGTVTWTCIVDTVYAKGFKGFTIPAAFSDDGDVLRYVAIQADRVVNHGDVG